MKLRLLLLGVLACAAASLPRAAAASADYPGRVQTDWRLSSTPDCTICHQSNLGGAGTATKFFARSLQREGLIERNDGSLDTALAALQAQSTDSDGDGITDIDELQMGTDPNDGPGPMEEFPTPMTGCAVAAHDRKNERDSWAWLLAMAGAMLALRMRRPAPRAQRAPRYRAS